MSALVSYNNHLVAGGYFSTAGGISASHIALWNGTANTWSALGSGTDSTVFSLAIYDSNLYAGGAFTRAGGVAANHIALYTMPNAVNEISTANEEATIYPNPNKGKFNIRSSGASHQLSVEIYNILGLQVHRESFNEPGQTLTSVDISNQPAGVYIYSIVTEEGTIVSTGRFVIK